jgi:hypothetical protein
MAPLVQETNLAWALAEAITPHLSVVERNHVFVVIGAGEAFAAIRHLFKSAAFKRIPLRPDLLRQCTSWLHAYVGHEDERYLRHLIENHLMPDSIHVLTTRPNAGQVVTLAAHRHRIGTATDVRFGIGAAGQLSPGSVAGLASASKGRPSRAAKTRSGSR